ncbi:integrase core domain protein, partial [Teladorsagia circumcincta]
MSFLETGSFPPGISPELRKTCSEYLAGCTLKSNGCLYYLNPSAARRPSVRPAIVVPSPLREPICLSFHDSPSAGGHFSWKKTLAKISRRFFWPTMREDVFNKFAITSPLPDCTSVTVAHALATNAVFIFGTMTTLVSDNASYLKSDLLSELGRLLRIGRYFTSPYHHEGNGACERMFATFQEMLRTYISSNQDDWDLFLPACTFAYNTSVHSSTNDTPFFLMFGRDPVFNIDLLIRHGIERHLPTNDDSSIYKES